MASRKNRNVILLPVWPEFANTIFNGKKKIEFRKVNIPKGIEYVVVYATSPEKRIVGYFKVDNITQASPEELWQKFCDVGCVKEEFLMNYYSGEELGVAIHVGKAKKAKKEFRLSEIDESLSVPQSFRYLTDNEWEKIKTNCGSIHRSA